MTDAAIEWPRILAFLAGALVVIVATGAIAFGARRDKAVPFAKWLDQDSTLQYVLVGAVAGFVFGFVDNVMLGLGIDALESALARLPGGGNSTLVAGYGNAVSSVISAFTSTFVSKWVASTYDVDVDKAPLWAMAAGILVGCLAGIAPVALMR